MNSRYVEAFYFWLTALVMVMCVPLARGEIVVADFGADLQETTPKPGWNYLWNANGPIGSSADYVALLATPAGSTWFENRPYYTPDGLADIGHAEPAADLYFGLNGLSGTLGPGGHPGRGSKQDSLGIERYAIAAFALSSTNGPTAIRGALNVPTPDGDGDHLRVFVNNSETLFNLDVPHSTSRSFNLDLGVLQGGDIIYVAVGPKNADYFDGFYLNYQIIQQSVPEPVTLTMLGIGSLCIVGYGRHRKTVSQDSSGSSHHRPRDSQLAESHWVVRLVALMGRSFSVHQVSIEIKTYTKNVAAATPPINTPSHGLPNKSKTPAATHAPLPIQSDTGKATPQLGPSSPCTTAFPM